MKNLKQLLGVFLLSFGFFVLSVQATDNIYKIDTNGAQDSPKPLADIYEQGQINNAPETMGNYLSLKPSGTVWGLMGKQPLAMGQGMLPFGGNGVDSSFYGIAEGEVGMKRATGYSAGVGGGYRKIFNNSFLVGGYLLADWNRSPLSHNFWIGNLGVEVLDYNWDFRVNAYIPVGKKYWLGDTKTGTYEETTTGFDAEIGRILPIPKTQGLKLFVGGYRFNMNKTHTVAGVEARGSISSNSLSYCRSS